ncbi:MAG TPA: hypothetical protein DDW65_01250 [Firmicutes bacterium]|nr:hypothetical protein [Bacillota bacterium]
MKMAIWPISTNAFIAGWVNLMMNAIWQGSLVLLFVWVLLRLFSRIHPAIQCWLWRFACLKPLITLVWVKPLILHFQLQIGLRQLGWLLANFPQPSRHLAKMTQSLLQTAQPLPFPTLDGATGFWFLLWLTGLIVLLTGLFYLGRRQQMISNSCVSVADPVIITLYQDLGRRNKFRKMPPLFTAEGISSPLLQGIVHPKIIVPAMMVTDFAADELRLIFAHELAHYQRGDLFWNWLPALARTVFFFLPYIGRIEKKIAQLQEICCDRLALQYTQTPAAKFGRVLVQVSLRQGLSKKAGLSAGFVSQSLELLKSRLQALQSVHPMNRKWVAFTGVILLILGGFTVIPWQLVSTQTLPVNLVLTNYLSRGRFELSAHVMLPKKEIKTITALIDGKPLSATYNANGIYLGFARPNEDNFPREGPHKVTVKAQTTTGVKMDQNWIYFYDSMIWSSQNLGLGSNKTLIKIGPFFWVVNNRSLFLSSLL